LNPLSAAALARGAWSVSHKRGLAADASIRCSPSGAHVRDPTRLPKAAMLPSRTRSKSPENPLEKTHLQPPPTLISPRNRGRKIVINALNLQEFSARGDNPFGPQPTVILGCKVGKSIFNFYN